MSQLSSVQVAKQWVDVPEWDCEALVHELTGAELDAYRQSMLKTRGAKVISMDLSGNTARLLSYAIKDEAGNRVFGDDDIQRLLALPAGGLERCAAVARKLSRLSDEDDEELEGNSDAGKTGGSTSS